MSYISNVTFSGFRIREILAKDHRSSGRAKKNSGGVMTLSPEISFACPDVVDPENLHLLVIVRLASALLKGKSIDSAPAAEVLVEGEARFDLSGIDIDTFKGLFSDIDFLDRLSEQVYPMVNHRLASLLNDMGFKTSFPLSLPDKEGREILSLEEKQAALDKISIVDSKPARKRVPRKTLTNT